jgi:peptidoglycan/xylan/chitin deacetylase (PgdA/CDA1 family)
MRRRVRLAVDAVAAPALGSWSSSTDVDSIALTLDDGPDPIVTPALIDLFAQLEVRATFFILTLRAERYPRLVERLIGSGHEVALHGLDHRRVNRMSERRAYQYISEARERLEQITGNRITMYRPPYGAQSIRSFRAARRAGLRVVVWNCDAADWEDRPAADVTRLAVAACRPGGILLFHERLEPDPERGSPETSFNRVVVINDIVRGLARRGLAARAVGDLAADAQMLRTVWFRP